MRGDAGGRCASKRRECECMTRAGGRGSRLRSRLRAGSSSLLMRRQSMVRIHVGIVLLVADDAQLMHAQGQGALVLRRDRANGGRGLGALDGEDLLQPTLVARLFDGGQKP